MDIKLKKSFRVKYSLIALIVLLPALLLVLLYPKMEDVMVEKRGELEKEWEKEKEERYEDGTFTYEVSAEFINYAMEASYYIYGQLLKDSETESVNFAVLQEYGWIEDYHQFYDNADFIASYTPEGSETPYEMKNTDKFSEKKAHFICSSIYMET